MFGTWFTAALLRIEAHSALVQAMSGVLSAVIAAGALLYAVRTLKALQRQTEAAISLTTETFRPVIEVLGGSLSQGESIIRFRNKGNGAALNFRWRVSGDPEIWRVQTSNLITPQEEGTLTGEVDWQRGLVLSYNSVTHCDELLTFVKVGPTGSIFNHHEAKQGAALTRLGWTIMDPNLNVPGFASSFVAEQSRTWRLRHWWRMKRGLEREF